MPNFYSTMASMGYGVLLQSSARRSYTSTAWGYGIMLPAEVPVGGGGQSLISRKYREIRDDQDLVETAVSLWCPDITRITGNSLPDLKGRLRLSANGNVAVIRSNTEYVSDSDASNDFWQADYVSNPIPRAFAISVWLERDSTAGSFLGLGSTAATRQAIHLRTLSATSLRFGMYGDDLDVTTSSMATFTHIVCQMLNDNTMEVWQDGVRLGTRAGGGFYTGNGLLTLHHDSWNGTSDWDGRLDDIRIFPHSLTSQQIVRLYNNGQRGIGLKPTRLEYDEPPALTYPGLSRGAVATWCLTNTQQPMSGTKLFDWSLGKHHGTLTGTFAGSFGIQGGRKSLDFDAGDSVNVAYDARLHLQGDLTLTAWIYPETIANLNGIIGHAATGESSATNAQYLMYFSGTGGDIVLGHEYGSGTDQLYTFSSAAAIDTNQWHHVTGVRDSAAKTWTLYVDGKKIGEQAYTNQTDGGGSTTLHLGDNAATGGSLRGGMDDVRIYDRCLGSAEIRHLATRPGIAFERSRADQFVFQPQVFSELAATFNAAWGNPITTIAGVAGGT